MFKPIHLGGDAAHDIRNHATFQHWLKVNFSDDDGAISVAAQQLRAENAQRFKAYLSTIKAI